MTTEAKRLEKYACYNRSEKGQARVQRYEQSAKGQATRASYETYFRYCVNLRRGYAAHTEQLGEAKTLPDLRDASSYEFRWKSALNMRYRIEFFDARSPVGRLRVYARALADPGVLAGYKPEWRKDMRYRISGARQPRRSDPRRGPAPFPGREDEGRPWTTYPLASLTS